jgi:hypothetical protein
MVGSMRSTSALALGQAGGLNYRWVPKLCKMVSSGLASTPRMLVTLGKATTLRASRSVTGRLPVRLTFAIS